MPTATPELNVLDCLWRHVRDRVLANEPLPRLRDTLERAVAYLHDRGWLDSRMDARVEVLAWGVSNAVLRVTPEMGDAFVIKQSRSQLRTRDPWFSRLDRIWRDVRGRAGAGVDAPIPEQCGQRAKLGDLRVAVPVEELDARGPCPVAGRDQERIDQPGRVVRVSLQRLRARGRDGFRPAASRRVRVHLHRRDGRIHLERADAATLIDEPVDAGVQ